MNTPLVCRMLGQICLLITAAMVFSLPWAFPWLGETARFEAHGLLAMLGAGLVSASLAVVLLYLGRKSVGQTLYRKEAMAVVGLSWLLATVLGALPYLFSGTCVGRDERGNPRPMSLVDAVFESASGFSGTGASVLTDVEDPALIPRCVLFWRSETHFLGGLGIMVLFVAILGFGSAGKALMITEVPALTRGSAYALSQHAAWAFAGIFIGLNAILTVVLILLGMRPFEALCHAFGTVATGGFSTRNASIGAFNSVPIEMVTVLFMFLGCTNFALLYFLVLFQPKKLFNDPEFRVYALTLLVAIAVTMTAGLWYGDFAELLSAFRYSAFQVTSILTNTGFATEDFDRWNGLGRGLLLVLMFIGGCAGSTSCSIKIIRHMLLWKILALDLEKAFRPSIVRHIRLGGRVLEEPELRPQVLVYFALILVICLVSWLVLIAVEPDENWLPSGVQAIATEPGAKKPGIAATYVSEHSYVRTKLLDCASAVAATINGVGPGLGVVGPTRSYTSLHWISKLVLTALMLLGRLEVYPILVLLMPRFWWRK